MKKKRFLTYDEQIAFLREKKNLEITDEEYVKRILFQTGYFPLINGYKELYKDPRTNHPVHKAIFEKMGFPVEWERVGRIKKFTKNEINRCRH